MAKTKSGTRLYGVPPDYEMREARDALRREAREALEQDAREALHSAVAKPPRRIWGKAVADNELALDYAALRDALKNIQRARALKPRNGNPTDIQTLLRVVDALDRDAIPITIWIGSPAHRRIKGLIGDAQRKRRAPPVAGEPPKPKHDRAMSVLRRLRGLGRRIGLRN